MRATFALTNPNDCEATLAVTMTLEQWKRLREQLSRDYPSWQLSDKIDQMIQDAAQHFVVTDKEAL